MNEIRWMQDETNYDRELQSQPDETEYTKKTKEFIERTASLFNRSTQDAAALATVIKSKVEELNKGEQ